MQTTNIRIISTALFFIAVIGPVGYAKAEVNERPNVLVRMVDDTRCSDLGCYGSEIGTPHLDALAAGSLRSSQVHNTARHPLLEVEPTNGDTSLASETTAPTSLRVSEGFENPIGFHDATPTFSWQLPQDGTVQRQTAYQVVVASDPALLPGSTDLWNSGRVVSSQSVWIPYQGKPIQSRDQAFWQVRFWDENGQASAWSDMASLEMGLLCNADWSGCWIQMRGEKPHEPPRLWADSQFVPRDDKVLIPEYLRHEFALNSPIEKARLYVTAKGVFQVHLNGLRVGEDQMAPGWTTYKSWTETLTYDVTDQLRKGDNAIGVVIAEGWYAGRIGCPEGYTATCPEFLCQLEIQMTSGETITIVTNDEWTATNTGPIRYSSIFDGEVYDANLEMENWTKPGFDDTQWSEVIVNALEREVALVPKHHRPVRVTQRLSAKSVTEPAPGCFVFDFGQNLVGKPRLRLPVKAGKTVRIRFAEMLQEDGTLYTENYRSAHSTDYYTAATDATIDWQPAFTFHGFRYVELSGLPEDAQAESVWVTALVMHSDFQPAGHFTSSQKKLNRLQENIRWGQRGNFLDIPTDCPQRDERQGWTGDAQVFCPTSMFNYDVHAFWASWLRSMRANQLENGIVPWVIPYARRFKNFGSAGWGDAAVTIPWEVYVRTGDRTILSENYAMMQRWVDAYESDAKDYIVHRDGFGDWLQPYSEGNLQEKRGALVGETALELIATAYYGHCTEIMQQVARVLGKEQDAERYADQFASIRQAFSNEFFDDDAKLTTAFETQTGYLLAIGFDLLEPPLRDKATEHLLRKIDEAGGHLRTGFLGTPLIAAVLDAQGHTDTAYSVLLKESYPSWLYSINQGATTMWERWNSYSHEDGFGDAKMNSFNHYAYGAIGLWMYERVAGLAPDPRHPGYKHFFIQPAPGGPLSWAKAELATPYGKAASGWKIEDRELIVSATVPPNTTATFVVPSIGDAPPQVTLGAKVCSLARRGGRMVYDLQPGQYRFKVSQP